MELDSWNPGMSAGVDACYSFSPPKLMLEFNMHCETMSNRKPNVTVVSRGEGLRK